MSMSLPRCYSNRWFHDNHLVPHSFAGGIPYLFLIRYTLFIFNLNLNWCIWRHNVVTLEALDKNVCLQLDSAAAGIEPAISSRKSDTLTTTPPSHTC